MEKINFFTKNWLRAKVLALGIYTLISPMAVANPQLDLDAFYRAVTDGRESVVLEGLNLHPEWANAELFAGIRPLYRASVMGRESIVKALLASGADVKTTTDRGTQALQAALLHGYDGIGLRLLEGGAEVNEADERGQTPIFFAVRFNREEMLEPLIDKGALVRVADGLGRTPLHYAAGMGRLEAVDRLLQCGALTDVVDKEGFSPLGLCLTWKRNDFQKVAELLQNQGAKDVRPLWAWKILEHEAVK